MSDIAMLVAEEFERRTKNFKKEQREIKMVSLLALTMRLKEKVVMDKKRDIAKWVNWEPKTQFAVAACNSFFSA